MAVSWNHSLSKGAAILSAEPGFYGANEQPDAACLKIFRNASGLVVDVELTNGKHRQFRYKRNTELMWISEGDDQYFRPDANGKWLRKTGKEKYLVENLRVDKAGSVYYDRFCEGRFVHCVERVDGSRIGYDGQGKIARIDYSNGTFRSFEYNLLGQICRYISTDGIVWNANDELYWRQVADKPADVHGVALLEEDGTFRFINFGAKRDDKPSVTVCKTDGSRLNNMPLLPELMRLLKNNFLLMPIDDSGNMSRERLYEILRDEPVSGEMRVAATLLWDFACRYGLTMVTPACINAVIDEDDLEERAKLMIGRTIRLRNLYRQEDNRLIKRLTKFPKIACMRKH